MSDWLRDFGGIIATVLGVAMTGALGWIKNISSRVSSAHRRINETRTEVAVLKTQAEQVPELLREIKTEIRGMRDDGKAQADALREDGQRRSKELYRHIDGLRKEFKGDLAGKADRD